MPPKIQSSRVIYVPCAVSSFFEICDQEADGTKIKDTIRIGARGGGFIIRRGNTTVASTSHLFKTDSVMINKKHAPNARTTLKVIELMRKEYGIPNVRITHTVEPPIGHGFGTSGSGAIGTAVSISDLFGLNLTLSQVSKFAHIADVESVTGLGTVISLISGSGAMGLVTEPGSFSIGRVDSILTDHTKYTLI